MRGSILSMRFLKIILIVLFSTLPLGLILSLIGMFLGCQNYFELGCVAGVGNYFGQIGFMLTIATFITYPLGFGILILAIIVGVIWRISKK